MKTSLTIATRASKLALWQANFVADLLRQRLETTSEIKLLPVSTEGDRVQNRFLHEIGGKGLFIRELEESLLRNSAQLAVHSLKDMPARVEKPFRLAAILPRHQSGDLLIFHPSAPCAQNLPAGNHLSLEEFRALGKLTIATASLRRQGLLAAANPDVTVVPIRGNVDTRLAKLQASTWDGLILAAASLERLKITGFVTRVLEEHWFVPSPGQGALAIETLDTFQNEAIASLDDSLTRRAVTLERLILAKLGGDCTLPFACHLRPREHMAELSCMILTPKGKFARVDRVIEDWASFDGAAFDHLADSVVSKLLANGGREIMAELGLSVG